jgi:hypothetical protein
MAERRFILIHSLGFLMQDVCPAEPVDEYIFILLFLKFIFDLQLLKLRIRGIAALAVCDGGPGSLQFASQAAQQN